MPRTQAMASAPEGSAPAAPFAWADEDARDRIALVKRFWEWLAADPSLGVELRAAPGQGREIMAGRGLDFDPEQVEPLWRGPLASAAPGGGDEGLPLLGLWQRWQESLAQQRAELRVIPGAPPRLALWRARQMTRCQMELGGFERNLTYPVFAFELSQGCSMGCSFCAFAAPRLTSVFRRTPDGARLWGEVLETCAQILGWEAVGSAMGYWASEPADNPDYLELLDDHARLSGRLAPTTTAAATRDLGWTRALLARYQGRPGLRFSILSLEMLGQIQAAFSARELLFAECLPQNPESLIPKSCSGRNRPERGQGQEPSIEPPPETTACLAGYKINLGQGSVELISPCPVSDDWPLGYRVHARGKFGSPAGLGEFIRATMEECMPVSPPPNQTLGLRPGLAWRQSLGSLVFSTPVARLRLPGGGKLAWMLPLLEQGDLTLGQLVDRAPAAGLGPLEAMAALELLFEKGLLDDTPARGWS